MPQNISIDDRNTSLIQYSGEWLDIVGSSRQWETGTHTTSQNGASATFQFKGYQAWVWGTIPAGSGSNVVDFVMDGGSANTTSRTSTGDAVYNEVYYASPILRDGFHTLVVTNRGSDEAQNAAFLLDRFEFETNDEIPMFAPSGSASAASASATATSTSSPITSSKSSNTSRTPWGGIIGAIVAVFVIIIAVLSYLLYRKSRHRNGPNREKMGTSSLGTNLLSPTPFPLPIAAGSPSPSSNTGLSPLRLPTGGNSDFSSSRPQISLSTTSNPVQEKGASGSELRLVSPVSIAPSQTHAIASPPQLESQIQSGPPTSQPQNATVAGAQRSSPSSGIYEPPPPSYWNGSSNTGSEL